ncbi:hypothetical protein ASD38_21830 [Caulobacter sp. Root487D2Y]|uniref:hypothetical protein n=1 Tax=Caulobacter sp. Root487D2Y TaxID=1736547 RepID=UPI0006F8D61D|nr:hypothetical protein [Caulobacter sp. Root487D2Y]KQY34381.1 hypothetical protein ASD38_21830 [Caulobacter sp. Root487D2Y]
MTSKTLPWRDAVLSGFRLVARRPAAAACWALLFTVESLAVRGSKLAFAQGVAAGGSVGRLAVATGIFAAVVDLLAFAIVGAAVMRAVIRPGDRGAWPRFGGDELRLLLLAAPVQVIGILVTGILIGLAIGFLGLGPRSFGALGMTGTMVMLAILGARLALAAPLTIARRRLTVRESVALTRGRHLQLAGILVTVMVIAGLISVFSQFARDVVANLLQANRPPGLLGSPSLSEALEAAFPLGQLPLRLMSGVTNALATAIQVAPLAHVCRELAGDPVDRIAAEP